MRSDRLQRLLAVGLVFVALGAIQWIWFEPNEIGAGMFTGGALVAIAALVLMLRDRPADRSPDPDR
jgi:hypothetical protein